jgi:hypothetical protein
MKVIGIGVVVALVAWVWWCIMYDETVLQPNEKEAREAQRRASSHS